MALGSADLPTSASWEPRSTAEL